MVSNPATYDDNLYTYWSQPKAATTSIHSYLDTTQPLPAFMTKAASKQTYYTIRWLVDRGRTADAYRAYAYFRWLDDRLDEELSEGSAGMALVERQQALVEGAYRGGWPPDLVPEEHMLLDLIQSDNERDSGLRAYIRHMMAVITFDARRRQQLISQQELDEYTTHLAIAVTEVLHHYIGHDQSAPHDATRYLAVAGAHIAHMLRDTYEDIAAGYYNIPCEVLDAYGIAPWDVTSPAYRDWVKSRVQLAREYFRAGRGYLVQVESVRARVAGYAYVVRFEGVLDAIERDDYQLQPRQGAGKSLLAGLRMGWSVFTRMLRDQLTHSHRLSPAGVQEPSPF